MGSAFKSPKAPMAFLLAGGTGELAFNALGDVEPLFELVHGPQVPLHSWRDLPEGHLHAGHLALTLLADPQLRCSLTELLLRGLV